jgi:hypothetical protein
MYVWAKAAVQPMFGVAHTNQSAGADAHANKCPLGIHIALEALCWQAF